MRGAHRALVVLVLVLACGDSDCGDGCECVVGERRSTGVQGYEECEEELCGTVVVAGSARIVTTWHPGEHALAMDPASRVLPDGWSGSSVEAIQFLWDCEPGGRLFVQGTELRKRLDDIARRQRTDITVWNPDAGEDTGFVGHGRYPLVRVEGSAPCWIDDVVIEWRVTSCGEWSGESVDGGPGDGGPPDAAPPDAGSDDAGSFDAAADGPIVPDADAPDATDGGESDSAP